MDAQLKRQPVKDQLGIGVEGRDIKHICPPLPRRQKVDGRGYAAAGSKEGEGVKEAPAA